MGFTQIITVEGAEDHQLYDLVAKWDEGQSGDAPGYEGVRVLVDGAGRHLIEVDFSSDEEVRRNADRPGTRAWADELRELADGQPSNRDLRQVCSTYRRS